MPTIVLDEIPLEVTAADADGQSHLVDLAAADTTNWTAGEYRWQSSATKGTESYTLDEGVITIRSNFAAQTNGFDAHPHIYIMRDALERGQGQQRGGG